MNKIKCLHCDYTIIFVKGIDILKVKFTCPECGSVTVTEEIV